MSGLGAKKAIFGVLVCTQVLLSGIPNSVLGMVCVCIDDGDKVLSMGKFSILAVRPKHSCGLLSRGLLDT